MNSLNCRGAVVRRLVLPSLCAALLLLGLSSMRQGHAAGQELGDQRHAQSAQPEQPAQQAQPMINATPASAHASAAASNLPVCRLDPQDNSKLLTEPCRPAPPVQSRRAVTQLIGRMPTQMPPPVMQYHSLPPPTLPVPTGPVPIGSCDIGGCRDGTGARYNGTGNTTLDANGRICHRNGAFMQCF